VPWTTSSQWSGRHDRDAHLPCGRHEVRYRVEVDVDAARKLYETEHSLVTVGKKLGVSAGTIRNLMCQAGVQTRAVGTSQWSEAAAAPPPD
jgi:hypothetical protein